MKKLTIRIVHETKKAALVKIANLGHQIVSKDSELYRIIRAAAKSKSR